MQELEGALQIGEQSCGRDTETLGLCLAVFWQPGRDNVWQQLVGAFFIHECMPFAKLLSHREEHSQCAAHYPRVHSDVEEKNK